MTQENKQELEVYKGQIGELETTANKLSITSPEQNATAIELKATLAKIAKDLKAKKEAITKPLNLGLRNARELFAPYEKWIDGLDREVGMKLLGYKKQVDEEARKIETRIGNRVEKGTMKMETAERKIDELEHIEKKTDTAQGRVQFRKILKVRVIDESKIPDNYWFLDMVLIRRAALSGIVVPGTEIYEEETV